jgi:hypothetical protein
MLGADQPVKRIASGGVYRKTKAVHCKYQPEYSCFLNFPKKVLPLRLANEIYLI